MNKFENIYQDAALMRKFLLGEANEAELCSSIEGGYGIYGFFHGEDHCHSGGIQSEKISGHDIGGLHRRDFGEEMGYFR